MRFSSSCLLQLLSTISSTFSRLDTFHVKEITCIGLQFSGTILIILILLSVIILFPPPSFKTLICAIIICILLVNFINKYYEFSCQIQFVFRSSNLMDRVVLLGVFNYIKIHTLIKLYMMMQIVCK